jgi:hypothetical protein
MYRGLGDEKRTNNPPPQAGSPPAAVRYYALFGLDASIFHAYIAF